ncbi:glycoside hydrolase family 15 protein [Solicola gregarius]|uniref:Trehalase n=1 Tax=Solicola gregarius TaxID=2908642 RepID=A0AA46THL3_9ACTN|nr:glycoside hydrolase family 15 protein [Solicola gregarius]UYM04999.1 glycoside hydrolase family 15 protein [Solicola gregarius]
MTQRIEDYGLLGDLQTAALVGRNGAIDWLCLPRFDSGACFAALLGDEESGTWRIAPVGAGDCTRRRYRGDTLILETEWETPDGSVRVIDFMPPRGEAADIVRIVEGLSGRVTVESTLKIRFDYGSIVPWVRRNSGQLEAVAGPDAVWLRTPVDVRSHDLGSYASFEVAAGDRVPFVLTYKESHRPAPHHVEPEQALRDTETFWHDWIATADVPDRWSEPVRRSLIILKALTYAPTGGVLAAATTSLPEQLGGPRNWDYRYCWLRDSTFTLRALIGCGYVEEAKAWREWLLRAVAGDPADLQIMYGIDGTRRLLEYELDWLSGYEGSRPVRVGNAASDQLQLDVWGEVLASLDLARAAGLAPDDHAWDLQVALLEHLEGNWQQEDNGIWEGRGPRRDFVHSKVMSWVGLDRGVHAVEHYGLEGPADRWRAARDEIHAEVCAQGFDAERNTFTQFYGSQGLDAALLLLPQTGFLPPDDPRVVGTVDAIGRELSHDGLILRYDPTADGGVDGLPGTEGTFLACSFWMVNALRLIGRHDDAVELFERLVSLRSDLGLLAEEYDVPTGRQLGNTPQAYSHVGMVNCARALAAG